MGDEYFSAKNIDISLFLCYNYKNNLGRQIMEELLKRLMSYARVAILLIISLILMVLIISACCLLSGLSSRLSPPCGSPGWRSGILSGANKRRCRLRHLLLFSGGGSTHGMNLFFSARLLYLAHHI